LTDDAQDLGVAQHMLGHSDPTTADGTAGTTT